MRSEGAKSRPLQAAASDPLVTFTRLGTCWARGCQPVKPEPCFLLALPCPACPLQGQKFVVADRPARTAPRGFVPLTPEEQAAERARRAARAADADADAAALPALFE